jgi:hypothetical protein
MSAALLASQASYCLAFPVIGEKMSWRGLALPPRYGAWTDDPLYLSEMSS